MSPVIRPVGSDGIAGISGPAAGAAGSFAGKALAHYIYT